jgi:hypothetical protein
MHTICGAKPSVNTQLAEFPLSLIPIRRDKKRPFVYWTEFQTRQPTQFEYDAWGAAWPDCNWAIITGGHLAVVDLDGPEEIALWDSISDLPPTFTVRTGRGEHRYYRTEEPAKTGRRSGILIKGEGAYVLAPGSVHLSGVRYTVIDHRPVATAIIPLRDSDFRHRGAGNPGSVDRKTDGYASRSEAENAIITRLIRKGYSDAEIWAWFTRPINRSRVPRFLEELDADPATAERWLQMSIDNTRSYLDAHDEQRESLVVKLSRLVIEHTRKAVHTLWDRILEFMDNYGILRGGQVSFCASKRQLGDTAYRAFGVLQEVLRDMGYELTRKAGPANPKSTTTSTTYYLSTVAYGEGESDGEGGQEGVGEQDRRAGEGAGGSPGGREGAQGEMGGAGPPVGPGRPARPVQSPGCLWGGLGSQPAGGCDLREAPLQTDLVQVRVRMLGRSVLGDQAERVPLPVAVGARGEPRMAGMSDEYTTVEVEQMNADDKPKSVEQTLCDAVLNDPTIGKEINDAIYKAAVGDDPPWGPGQRGATPPSDQQTRRRQEKSEMMSLPKFDGQMRRVNEVDLQRLEFVVIQGLREAREDPLCGDCVLVDPVTLETLIEATRCSVQLDSEIEEIREELDRLRGKVADMIDGVQA